MRSPTLEGLCIRGEGGYTGTKRIPYTTKFGLALPFFWDTSFTCTGLREFDPTLAQEAILCFAENAGPRGSLPGTMCDTHRAGEGQAPIMSWAAWLTYQRGRDKAWLGRIYPALAGNHRFWFKYHCTPRGLCQFFNAGQIADNDARFDPVQGNDANQSLRGRLESPDINAFLVIDARSLAKMADELGQPEAAQAWRDEADGLAKRIVDTMYFPDEAMFYDVKTGTHEKLSGVKTPNMFLPLWAAAPLAARSGQGDRPTPHAQPQGVLPRSALPQPLLRQPLVRPPGLLARPHLAARRLLDDPNALAAGLRERGGTICRPPHDDVGEIALAL